MPPRFSAARLWCDVEDLLIPALRLTTHERALYYHLLRRTRLANRRTLRTSRRALARASGLSTTTARLYLRILVRKHCVRILDRSARGTLLEVLLPAAILHPSQRSPSSVPLTRPALDAAGQPRAWPRSIHVPGPKLRRRIFRRERGRCFYCLRRLRRREWVLDHVVPVARGGSDSPSNLVASCFRCNWQKGLSPAADFLRSLCTSKTISPSQLRSRLLSLATLSALR